MPATGTCCNSTTNPSRPAAAPTDRDWRFYLTSRTLRGNKPLGSQNRKGAALLPLRCPASFLRGSELGGLRPRAVCTAPPAGNPEHQQSQCQE